ncbi:ATP-binding protein [Cutibacterium acnes JCM 18918]|nr:ATP-binding protein [Cutibacterium acnes JCM 18918]
MRASGIVMLGCRMAFPQGPNRRTFYAFPIDSAAVARTIILLAGPSGSGKSHLTHMADLPELRLDDFYRDHDEPGLPVVRDMVDWDDVAPGIFRSPSKPRGTRHHGTHRRPLLRHLTVSSRRQPRRRGWRRTGSHCGGDFCPRLAGAMSAGGPQRATDLVGPASLVELCPASRPRFAAASQVSTRVGPSRSRLTPG